MGAVLTYTQPLFVFCLAVPFLDEKIEKVKLAGAIVGFAGVILLFLGSAGFVVPGSSVIMVFGAFLWAVNTVYYKRFLSHVDSLITCFFQWSFGILPIEALNLYTNDFVFPLEATYIFIVLFMTIGGACVGWIIWFFLLGREDATVISGSSFIVPMIALFSGWFILGENVSIESIFGSALVLSGVVMVNMKNRKKNNKTSARQSSEQDKH